MMWLHPEHILCVDLNFGIFKHEYLYFLRLNFYFTTLKGIVYYTHY